MSIVEKLHFPKPQFAVVLGHKWDVCNSKIFTICVAPYQNDGFNTGSIEKYSSYLEEYDSNLSISTGTIVQVGFLGLHVATEKAIVNSGIDQEKISSQFQNWCESNKLIIEQILR